MNEESRAQTDRAKEMFQKRLAAAESVQLAAPIDWAAYKAALPSLDVDAIRRDFEAQGAGTPAIAYDESAEKSAHDAKETTWQGFARYCATRVSELRGLQAEQDKHKLTPTYRRRQLYARFPGLYENAHNRVRGQWDPALWATYLAYRSGATALPWDVNHGAVDDAKKRAIILGMAERAGMKPEELGVPIPAAPAAPVAAAPVAAAHH